MSSTLSPSRNQVPWKLRREVYFIVLGALTLALSAVVFALNQNVATDLLAGAGVLGAIAIVLVAIPGNGDT